MKKSKCFSVILSILLVFQVSFAVNAGNVTNSEDGLTDFESAHQYVYDLPEDDSPRIPDSESTLLPQTYNIPSRSSVDLSNSVYFPEVGDQKNIGNCTSWAAVYYQFGFQVASNYSLDVSNKYNLFSPKWIHNIAKDNSDNNGTTFDSVYDILLSNGSVRYSKFAPTDVKVANPSTEYVPWHLNVNDLEEALRYRVSRYERLQFADIATQATPITSYNSACLDNMKLLLANGLVLTYGTDFGDMDWVYGRLTNQHTSSLNGEYVCIGARDADNKRSGHAMAIVGYDDDITYDLNGNGKIENFEKGAFKVVNSHGTRWRNKGFVWVMYDALNKTSNAVQQNYTNRQPVFEKYGYYAISVKEYPRDVIAKVKLNHSDRRQVRLTLGVSGTNVTFPKTTIPTMLLQNLSSSNVNFSGTGTTAEDATFVFDFGDLYALDTERSNCYIRISDSTLPGSTIVKEIKLIDGTGKTIVLDTTHKTINGTAQTYRFKLGIVGDVNNDTWVSAADATLIQKYCASLITLSSEDLKVADVNGDGKVTAADATAIQKYSAGIINEFGNGSVVLLDSEI